MLYRISYDFQLLNSKLKLLQYYMQPLIFFHFNFYRNYVHRMQRGNTLIIHKWLKSCSCLRHKPIRGTPVTRKMHLNGRWIYCLLPWHLNLITWLIRARESAVKPTPVTCLYMTAQAHTYICTERNVENLSAFLLTFTVDENKDSSIQHKMTCKTVNRRKINL